MSARVFVVVVAAVAVECPLHFTKQNVIAKGDYHYRIPGLWLTQNEGKMQSIVARFTEAKCLFVFV